MLTRLKRTENGITCNGRHIRTVDPVKDGDEIVLRTDDSSFLEPVGSFEVPIVYEDDYTVIFDKPFGIAVHPSIKHQGDTLGNYFAYLYPELTFRPVNRLDRDTSGLCLVAKDAYTAGMLQGKLKKVYYAVVQGITEKSGTIDAPVARERESIILRCVREDGQKAVTHYKRLEHNDKYSLLEINLETGRTHQIRVHFSHIGHALAGDDMYGGSTQDIARQALHCGKLIFSDVMTNELREVFSELPEDIKNLLKE